MSSHDAASDNHWKVERRTHALVVSSNDPVLLDKTREFIELLHHRLKTADRRQLENMIDQLIDLLDAPPNTAMLKQARFNAEARAALIRDHGALTSAQIHDLYGTNARNKAALATRWRNEGKILGVDYRGERLYPAFQFAADGRPHSVIASVLSLFGPDTGEWQIALWFVTPNGWLDGKRPIDIMISDPDAVVEAARDEAEPGVY